MATSEAALAFQWLYATLSVDTTLAGYAPGGIFRGIAPPGTTTPFVVFNLQSAIDVITANAVRIMVNGLLQVKAVGYAAQSAAIMNAASRIDDLIGSPPVRNVSVTGGFILSSYRESLISLDETLANEFWLSTGGLYRVLLEQAP